VVAGEGIRATERSAGVDRKTVRRYVAAAVELGLIRDGPEEQLSDEFIDWAGSLQPTSPQQPRLNPPLVRGRGPMHSALAQRVTGAHRLGRCSC